MEKIDLHGIKHEAVMQKLDSFFWKVMQKNKSEVEVITGISDRMKQIVKEVCKDYNFKVTDHPTNVGCLIVRIN